MKKIKTYVIPKIKGGDHSRIVISEKYNLSPSTITKILSGRIWAEFATEKYNKLKRIRRTKFELNKAN